MKVFGGASLIGLVALAATACASGPDREPAEAPGAANTAGTEVPTFVEPECDDTSDCAAGFVLDDTFYALSCGAVRPDAVTDETLARGELYQQQTEVRAVEGVSPEVLVAVSVDGGVCGDVDVALSSWSMAFPDFLEKSSGSAERDAAICAVVVDEQREWNNCD